MLCNKPVMFFLLILGACGSSTPAAESAEPEAETVECPVEHGQSCSWLAIPPSIHSDELETVWTCAIQFHPDDPIGEANYPTCPDVCCGERPAE